MFKHQFYLKYAKDEVQAKLHWLRDEIRDYVREFSELLLKIPDMNEKDAIFSFIDGLKPWAKMELQWRGFQVPSKAICNSKRLVRVQLQEWLH